MNAAQRNAKQQKLRTTDTVVTAEPTHAVDQFGTKAPLRKTGKGVSVPESTSSTATHTNREKTMATKTSKTRKAERTATTKRIRKTVASNHCLCGCGGLTRRSFCPGHDARLVGLLARGEIKSPNAMQRAFAKTHNVVIGSKAKPAKKARAAA